jgi:DNA repair protein RecO (recombination protein O)
MSSRVTDQSAFILRRRDWRDTSLLLDLFTRDHGCLRVVARGARRNPAKLPYQPFALLSLGWSGRQELKTLNAIEGVALPVDERNYLSLLYVNELLGAMLPAGEPDSDIFDAYLQLLRDAAEPLEESSLRDFEQRLMQGQGYLPDLDSDADSGQPIRADSWYRFETDSGFVGCEAGSPGAVQGQTVIDWRQRRYRQEGVLRLAKSVLRSTIDFNLHGKSLKSRQVYLEMLGKK